MQLAKQSATYDDDGYEPQGANPLQVLLSTHWLLRGRYWVALLLGGVLAAALAFVVYRVVPVRYQATEMLRINTGSQDALSEIDERKMSGRGFMTLQSELLRSNKVLTAALQDPKWQGVPAEARPTVDGLRQMIAAEPLREGDLIVLEFKSPVLTTVEVATHTVVDAYSRMLNGATFESQNRRLQLLRQMEKDLSGELESNEKQLSRIAGAYGVFALTEMTRNKVDEMSDTQSVLQGVANNAPKSPAAFVESDDQSKLASTDKTLSEFLADRRQLEYEIVRFGSIVGPNNKRLTELHTRLAMMNEEITRYAELVTRQRTEEGKRLGERMAGEMATRRDSLKLNISRLHDELVDLGARADEIQRKQRSLQDARDHLTGIRRRVYEAEAKVSATGSRVEVLGSGAGVVASNAKQRTLLAGVAGFAGLMAGFVCVAGSTLIANRYRFIDQTSHHLSKAHGMSVIGIVPELTRRDAPDDEVLAARASIYKTRLRIESLGGGGGPKVIALTSPSAGNGKTTLTMALGFSFASANQRTLLIDSDLTGCGLTHQLRTDKGLIGEALVRANVITPAERDQASRRAEERKISIGDAVVDMGFATRESVKGALDADARFGGLIAALNSDTPLEFCRPVYKGKLRVLRCEEGKSNAVAAVSPQSLRKLLNAVEHEFDHILIDTGPILGSAEAYSVLKAVDATIVVLASGESRHYAGRCMDELKQIQANVGGVIFNRASKPDFFSSHSSYTSSFHSNRQAVQNSPARIKELFM